MILSQVKTINSIRLPAGNEGTFFASSKDNLDMTLEDKAVRVKEKRGGKSCIIPITNVAYYIEADVGAETKSSGTRKIVNATDAQRTIL